MAGKTAAQPPSDRDQVLDVLAASPVPLGEAAILDALGWEPDRSIGRYVWSERLTGTLRALQLDGSIVRGYDRGVGALGWALRTR